MSIETIYVKLPERIPETKSYLGDGVYVQADLGGRMILTAEDGQKTNTIYIDDQVWDSLNRWAKRQQEKPCP